MKSLAWPAARPCDSIDGSGARTRFRLEASMVFAGEVDYTARKPTWFGSCAMYGNPQRRTVPQVQDLRREGGRWLRKRRESVGLSQRELAERVGAEYYTFISQLETGRGRIPPDRYKQWATALQMHERDFVRNVM